MQNQRKITIIDGDLDPSKERLCNALAHYYSEEATANGHDVKRIKVCDLKFDTILSLTELRHGNPPDDIMSAQKTINWCDHLFIALPLSKGYEAGRLTMFFEQVFKIRYNIAHQKTGHSEKFMKGKSTDIAVTVDMSTLPYRVFNRAQGIKKLKKNILDFCGINPVRVSYFGDATSTTPDSAVKMFRKIKCLARNP